ncbi:immunity 8 family protein [Pseudomonas vlassakiae]|nr:MULTISPECIES: Imm8 family immunity protein [Pseudomonas]MCU0124084.1 immunity 8 family protein [Pseudomonas vlassakiae]
MIHDCVSRCEGDNWVTIAIQLGKVFSWEFDGYQS